jgi:hypothetical protein
VVVRRYNLISETPKVTMFFNQLSNNNYRISRLNLSPAAVYKWINKYVSLMQKHLENIKPPTIRFSIDIYKK